MNSNRMRLIAVTSETRLPQFPQTPSIAESGVPGYEFRGWISVMGPVFQGGCDPAHIGAKPQRMVRTRVLEQRLF